jgi:hypothetical protein
MGMVLEGWSCVLRVRHKYLIFVQATLPASQCSSREPLALLRSDRYRFLCTS